VTDRKLLDATIRGALDRDQREAEWLSDSSISRRLTGGDGPTQASRAACQLSAPFARLSQSAAQHGRRPGKI
jgi:hypothetical protein